MNGIGFDPTQVRLDSSEQRAGGLGLVGMRERVEQLHGTLLVESAPGEGTTLMAAMPMTGDKRTAGRSIEAAKASLPLRRETQ